MDHVREHYPGFGKAVVIDVAPQIGVRQSRLIEGEYVVTKDDVVNRVHFADSVARGRGYYTPYRAMLPRGVEQLLVAGRHYSVTPEAQKLSREIPPCMSMGSRGVAAVQALTRPTFGRGRGDRATPAARPGRRPRRHPLAAGPPGRILTYASHARHLSSRHSGGGRNPRSSDPARTGGGGLRSLSRRTREMNP